MPRHRRQQRDSETNIWLGYTDLLSNSLFLLLLTVSVTIVARTFNDKPPMLQLTEKESFRFNTGSYALDQPFKQALERRTKEIRSLIKDYRIDVVEVIGHTDGQPNPGASNLDDKLIRSRQSQVMTGYVVGSNTDLGLLRAMAVAQELRRKLDPDGRQKLIFRPYSAANLINTDGHWLPANSTNQADRRRIELRLTRKEDFIPRKN